jgi:hypothetical protein
LRGARRTLTLITALITAGISDNLSIPLREKAGPIFGALPENPPCNSNPRQSLKSKPSARGPDWW